ncbi:hypothetical protein Rs2_51547 [Raphanus sativus]|nr:hypothetical protein Rs2_51547 [Raphanus sativus]
MTQCLNSVKLGSRLQALCSHAASESSLAPSFSSCVLTNAAFIGVNIGTDLTNMPSPSDIAIEQCAYREANATGETFLRTALGPVSPLGGNANAMLISSTIFSSWHQPFLRIGR